MYTRKMVGEDLRNHIKNNSKNEDIARWAFELKMNHNFDEDVEEVLTSFSLMEMGKEFEIKNEIIDKVSFSLIQDNIINLDKIIENKESIFSIKIKYEDLFRFDFNLKDVKYFLEKSWIDNDDIIAYLNNILSNDIEKIEDTHVLDFIWGNFSENNISYILNKFSKDYFFSKKKIMSFFSGYFSENTNYDTFLNEFIALYNELGDVDILNKFLYENEINSKNYKEKIQCFIEILDD